MEGANPYYAINEHIIRMAITQAHIQATKRNAALQGKLDDNLAREHLVLQISVIAQQALDSARAIKPDPKGFNGPVVLRTFDEVPHQRISPFWFHSSDAYRYAEEPLVQLLVDLFQQQLGFIVRAEVSDAWGFTDGSMIGRIQSLTSRVTTPVMTQLTPYFPESLVQVAKHFSELMPPPRFERTYTGKEWVFNIYWKNDNGYVYPNRALGPDTEIVVEGHRISSNAYQLSALSSVFRERIQRQFFPAKHESQLFELNPELRRVLSDQNRYILPAVQALLPEAHYGHGHHSEIIPWLDSQCILPKAQTPAELNDEGSMELHLNCSLEVAKLVNGVAEGHAIDFNSLSEDILVQLARFSGTHMIQRIIDPLSTFLAVKVEERCRNTFIEDIDSLDETTAQHFTIARHIASLTGSSALHDSLRRIESHYPLHAYYSREYLKTLSMEDLLRFVPYTRDGLQRLQLTEALNDILFVGNLPVILHVYNTDAKYASLKPLVEEFLTEEIREQIMGEYETNPELCSAVQAYEVKKLMDSIYSYA